MTKTIQYRMFPLKYAKEVAFNYLSKLEPHCHVANIAGSIRREKSDVKDIEIVCVPKTMKVGGLDLFGNDDRKIITSVEFVEVVNKLGKIIKGSPHGRMMQIELPEKIILDLFMPQPADYWRQFAIRTGSAEYSFKVIATGWLRIGWCGTPDGLRLQKECEQVEYKAGEEMKKKWVCKTNNPTLPPVWESEKEFFDFLGVQYLSPKLRTI